MSLPLLITYLQACRLLETSLCKAFRPQSFKFVYYILILDLAASPIHDEKAHTKDFVVKLLFCLSGMFWRATSQRRIPREARAHGVQSSPILRTLLADFCAFGCSHHVMKCVFKSSGSNLFYSALGPTLHNRTFINLQCVFALFQGRVCPSIKLEFISTIMGQDSSVPIKPTTRLVLNTHRRKSSQAKEIQFSVPVSKHSNILYWLRYLHFHRPHLNVDDGFQVLNLAIWSFEFAD